MRKFLTLLVITASIFSFTFYFSDAYAKRFGGGRSFGVSRPAASHSNNFSRTNANATKPSLGSRLLGPIAGLITGGLIASLLMGNGLASGIFTWIIVAIVGLLLVRVLAMRRSMQPRHQVINAKREMDPPNNNFFTSQAQPQTNFSSTVYPIGFDAENFLREVKRQFIRLQAAYDEKNITDIRRFTSPEVYAEIQLQLQERGDKENQTDVVELDAVLLDINQENGVNGEESIASVRFTGRIREDGRNVEPLNEIWHFRKEALRQEWVVAGIEQQ